MPETQRHMPRQTFRCDRLSDIASVIPLVDPEVVTLKHSAFLAQLLMEEVDLGESTPGGSHDHAVFSMRATDGPTGQVREATWCYVRLGKQ